MPVTGGALLDFSGLVGPEGSFVKKLKRLGCVILHKVKTVEFTYGPVGTNAVLGSRGGARGSPGPRGAFC